MNQRLLIAGAIAAVAFGAAYVLFATSQTARPSQQQAQAAPVVDVDQVLVARQNLPMGIVVNESAVAWQSWPKAALSELMITKSGDANAIKDVKGSMTRVGLIRGEPIRRDKLVKPGDGGGFMSAICERSRSRSTTAEIPRPAGSSCPTTALTSSASRATTTRQRREGSKFSLRRPFSPMCGCLRSVRTSRSKTARKS